ncbi:MAG: type I restriction endonuclease subunit R [Desulfovibrionaceae bacterium CG1_02_65_16]|nr:MAG: type I restriction endonuclease subunit R [Desulfovibrionaceae bacterium CG1_02_65_16]
MHEVSLGGMLTDYLTGKTIEETTYEEFRQALAKYLVEEKDYPKTGLKAKVPLVFTIDGEETGRHIDLVASDDAGRPIVIVIFCAGDVGSFERETVSCARLFPGGPVPVAIATDSIGASILDTASGDCVATGVRAIPTWSEALAIAAKKPAAPLPDERRRKEERILHAYNGFLYGTCCSESCVVPPKNAK